MGATCCGQDRRVVKVDKQFIKEVKETPSFKKTSELKKKPTLVKIEDPPEVCPDD